MLSVKTTRKRSILYDPYKAKKYPYITELPAQRACIFSPTEQNGATEQRTVNHAPAEEGQPVGAIELVLSRRHITRQRQTLVIVGQIVYDRLGQCPFSLTQHFRTIF